MKFELQEYELSELVEIKYGKNQKKVQNENGIYPILGTGGVMGYATEFLYNKPSVLIGRKGSISKVKYIEEPFWTVDTLFYTEVDEELVNPKYLYYYLSQIDLNYYNEGTTIPSLRTETLNKIRIQIPDLKIQKRIVTLIEKLDFKCESNERINRYFDALLKVLFKHWFIDFEFPNEEGLPYKASGGNMIESELGEIPDNWKVATLEDYFKLNYGKALTKKNRIMGNYPVYGSGGVTDYHKEFLIEGPGIIIGRKGSIGTIYYEYGNFFPIDTVFYVESKKYSLNFIHSLLKTYDFTKSNNDSAVPGLNRNLVYNTKAIYPDETIINYFEKILDPINKKIFSLKKETNSLIKLKDSLLPKLLTGEIEIPDESVVD